MKYYIYRMKFEKYLKQGEFLRVKNDLPSIPQFELDDGDKIIMIVSQSLIVIGAYRYEKKSNTFILEKKINKNVTTIYEKLPMITFVNERTYKLFAKRLREIDEVNYKAFLG